MDVQLRQMMIDVDGDKEFVALFSGKYDVSNKGECYKMLHAWLLEGHAMKKAMTCLVFFSKPLVFLITGKTRQKVDRDGTLLEKPKGDGKAVDDALLGLLPHLGEDQLHQMEQDGVMTEASVIRRKSKFRSVNFSMVRRCALLACQHLPQEGLVKQWMRVHGGRPLAVNTNSWDKNDQSWFIRAEQVEELQEDHALHSEFDWKAAFSTGAPVKK